MCKIFEVFGQKADQTKESHGKWISSLPISSYGHHLILTPTLPANDDGDDDNDDDHHLIRTHITRGR